MLGAIIGDIVGSRFEFNNYRKKDFEFLHKDCFFTDDSVMNVAIANALMTCKDYKDLSEETIKNMLNIGRRYPYSGYGSHFLSWLFGDEQKPYGSFGNGSAMRVSACGFIAKSIEEAKDLSYKVTCISHNHPEGIKGAEATAVAIYLARLGKDKDTIRDYIETHYYKLDFTIDEIRDTYEFDGSCQGTVPQAIVAFLESKDYEDAIRNAISIGGDSDTMAAITGGIAEAYYGIPERIIEDAKPFLDETLTNIIAKFYAFKFKR